MQFETETNAATTSLKIHTMPARYGAGLVSALRRAGLIFQAAIMRRVSGDALKVRTGNLRRSLFYRVEISGDDALVRVGVDLAKAKYGRVLEKGATITPTRSQFLTIPVGPNVTPKGVMRVNAREFIANPGSLGFVGSFPNRRRTAIMGVRADKSFEPVFALKRSVTIRPVGYIASAFRDNKAEAIRELRNAAIAISEGGDGSAD